MNTEKLDKCFKLEKSEMEDHRKEILNYLAKFKNSTKTRYELNGHGVTIADVTNIARSNFSEHKIVVNISGETKKKLEENAAYLKECLLKKEVIYGVNTGYGGSANVRSEDCDELNNVLLTFLNCGARSKWLVYFFYFHVSFIKNYK